jgi:hypothetical protein
MTIDGATAEPQPQQDWRIKQHRPTSGLRVKKSTAETVVPVNAAVVRSAVAMTAKTMT